MQIYYEFFISATISSPKMTRDSNELKQIFLHKTGSYSCVTLEIFVLYSVRVIILYLRFRSMSKPKMS